MFSRKSLAFAPAATKKQEAQSTAVINGVIK